MAESVLWHLIVIVIVIFIVISVVIENQLAESVLWHLIIVIRVICLSKKIDANLGGRGGQMPFETFPKIHPYWKKEQSSW